MIKVITIAGACFLLYRMLFPPKKIEQKSSQNDEVIDIDYEEIQDN